jgi:hypothetical protein
MQCSSRIFLLLFVLISSNSLQALDIQNTTADISTISSILTNELQQAKQATSANDLDKSKLDNLNALTIHKKINDTKKLQEEISTKDTNNKKITLKHVICALVIVGILIAAPFSLTKYLKRTVFHATKLFCTYAIPTAVLIGVGHSLYANYKSKRSEIQIQETPQQHRLKWLDQRITHNKKMRAQDEKFWLLEKEFMKKQMVRRSKLERSQKEPQEKKDTILQKTLLERCLK